MSDPHNISDRKYRQLISGFKREFLSQTVKHFSTVHEALIDALPACCPEHEVRIQAQLSAIEGLMVEFGKRVQRAKPVVPLRQVPEDHGPKIVFTGKGGSA